MGTESLNREVLYKDTGDSLLIKAFGPSPKLRIIDIFLSNPYFDFSREELTRELGMSKQTIYKNFKDLEELGMVKVSRRIGRAVMYRVNINNPFVKRLREIVHEASYEIAKQQEKKTLTISART